MRRVALALLMASLVQGNALATCVFSTITGPSFTYDPIGGASATATGSIGGSCDAVSATNVTLSLDAGLHSAGSSNPWRKMLNSATNDLLNYNLYTDAAHTSIWGDGTNATATQSFAQTASSWSYTMYALIPGGQNVAAGSFSDTVTVTMTY